MEKYTEMFYEALKRLATPKITDDDGFFPVSYNDLCQEAHLGKVRVKGALQELEKEKRIALKIGAGTARTRVKIL